MKLSKLISRFKKPIAVRRVNGGSMNPSLKDGQIVVFSSLKKANHKSIVLSSIDHRDYVKRLHETAAGYSLRGDYAHDSYDLEDISLKTVQASLIYPGK